MNKIRYIIFLTSVIFVLFGCGNESKIVGGYDPSHNDFINTYSEDTHIVYAFRIEDGQYIAYSDGSQKANSQMEWSKKSYYSQSKYKPDYEE